MKLGTHQVRMWKKPEPVSDELGSEPVDPDARLQARWTGGANLKTRSVYVGMLAALAAGPVALVLVFAGASSAAPPLPPKAATVADTGGEQAAVGEFAQQFVLAWLGTSRGKESVLRGFVDVTNVQLPDKAVTATQPATAGLIRLGADTWSVTVGVTVTDVAGTVRRYFQVPVRSQGGAMVSSMLPAAVAAPATATSPELGYQYTTASSDPVSVATAQFLSSLVAGSGDVTRYVSPGSSIAAVTPPPYSAVRLVEVRTDQDLQKAVGGVPTGGVVRVFATAEATVSAEQKIPVQYALTLKVREGRWEVFSLDPAPVTTTANTRPVPLTGSTTDTIPTPTSTTSVAPTTAPAAVAPSAPPAVPPTAVPTR